MGESDHDDIPLPQAVTGQETAGFEGQEVSSLSGPFSGRYNQFQRNMLGWSGLYPYNAVHAIRIPGFVPPPLFESRLNHVLSTCGLGLLEIAAKRGTYRFHPGNPACRVRVVEGGPSAAQMLGKEIEWQLNEPFPFEETFTPFRFFIQPSDTGSYLGIAYFHAVADAESIARLLIEIIRACRDDASGPVRDKSLFPVQDSKDPCESPLSAIRQIRAAIARLRSMRNSFRPPLCGLEDFHNEFSFLTFSPEETSDVLSAARRWGVTVNDLCLSALLLVLSPLAGERLLGKRPRLSVGCVVNLRRDMGTAKSGHFGLFLGSFTVTHSVPNDISLRDLAIDVHGQTAKTKQRKHYFAATIEFLIARLLFARLPPEKQSNFYRKGCPIWGSITNMKMEGLYQDLEFETPLAYQRAVSAGPAMPLVIAVTGSGGCLSFGISHRPGVLPTADVESAIAKFASMLKEAGKTT